MAASKSHTSSGSLESNWRLSNIDEWSPTSKTRNWLLISGASDPPERFIISDRRRRDESGEFLRGVTLDLHHMERAVKDDLHNSVKNLQITKSEVIGHIQEFFESCKEFYMKPMIFYTGHGERNTGNWCFSDGKLSFEDILNLIPAGMENPTIISDACFSGRWAIACDEHQRESLYCLSACGPDETARDSEKGGELTLYITNNDHKLPKGKLSRNPSLGGKKRRTGSVKGNVWRQQQNSRKT